MSELAQVHIVIFHYHLNPGGVTRIIESQVSSLLNLPENISVTLVTGSCSNPEEYSKMGAEVIIRPEMNYLITENIQQDQIVALYEKIYHFFQSTFSKKAILHFHNLNLGKNPLVTLAGSNLAAGGYNVVNHCHDFAEDRPANMQFLDEILSGMFGQDTTKIMYPILKNYFYCTINLADLRRLDEFGINCYRKFLIPNPVDLTIDLNRNYQDARKNVVNTLGLNPDRKIITYPVRVIKRKNIGEFILLSVLFKDMANWLVTLPPKNPVEVKRYAQWKSFCDTLQIRIVFEAGLNLPFEDIISASDFCLTTSIREGFGMVFMEPWMLGTPVTGRRIPYIIEDLTQAGIQFPYLYDELFVNLQGEIKDFKDFEVEEQQIIIEEAKLSENFQEEIFELNPELHRLFEPVPDELVDENKDIVKKSFSIGQFGERLYELYKRFFE